MEPKRIEAPGMSIEAVEGGYMVSISVRAITHANPPESCTVNVFVEASPGSSVREISKAALLRAIKVLQDSASDN